MCAATMVNSVKRVLVFDSGVGGLSVFDAIAASDLALERYLHLFALNRGILLTPFHNMALMSPATTEGDVYLHTDVFRQAVLELAIV